MTNPADTGAKKPTPTFTEAYHRRQWDSCYESTKAFIDFLEGQGAIGPESRGTIVDLCCGSGANLFWLSQRCPGLELVGGDVAPELVEFGNREFKARGVDDARLVVQDVYDLDHATLPDRPDGVIAIQTVSWLPDEVEFIAACAGLEPDWIALTGLMMPGGLTFRTTIENHDDPDKGVNFYNTFSLSHLEELLAGHGYGAVTTMPFEIGIDLPRPPDGVLGTYTETTTDGRRLQISGALLMNWRFLLARRTAA